MNINILHVIILFIIIGLIIQSNSDQLRTWLLTTMVVKRGILVPNCFWFRISDIVLEDGTGINLQNTLKDKYGDFPLTNQFNEPIYLVILFYRRILTRYAKLNEKKYV